MKLTEELFINIVTKVEEEGGSLIPDLHTGEALEYTIEGKHGRKAQKPIDTTGCGVEALVEIPYDLETHGGVGEMGLMRVCVIDDMMHLWPRYSECAEA